MSGHRPWSELRPDTNPTPVDTAIDVLATAESHARLAPGRYVGVSLTREQLAAVIAELRSARAAIPGPDTITVNRETAALRQIVNLLGPDAICECPEGCDGLRVEAAESLRIARAALLEPPAPKEQQPPPFDPDLELMANREGNRREVRAYRRDAQPAPSDVPEQP